MGSVKYSYKRPAAEQYPIYINRVIYSGAGLPYKYYPGMACNLNITA